jgi:16S rRNA (cytosine967-C5)-methyltransferase
MLVTGQRLEQAEAALRSILPLREPADLTLHRFFRSHPRLGAQDRAFVAETVYAVLRHLRRLEHFVGNREPRRLVLACLAKFAGLSAPQLEPFLSPAEISWLTEMKSVRLDDLAKPVELELPDWLYLKLAACMSESDVDALARALATPAPLDLRVNPLLAKRKEVIAALNDSRIEASATPYSPLGIRVHGKPSINRHPLFVEGKIEVQDESSQLACLLLAPKRREMVVDFCAGAGGKALLLGALMRSEGRVYAFDIAEKRLNNLKPRLKRSGLSNIHPQLIANENDVRVKRLTGKIDRVLVDAPCSGLGTLRRNPDLKWRQSPEALTGLKAKQAALMKRAASLVKPGGRLVYATCSILREENHEIVSDFLSGHPEFRVEPADKILARQRIALDTGEFLELYPQRHGCDAFFAAALEKERPGP